MTKPPLCKDQHEDGRVCALYLDHYGDHKENHLRSSWPNKNPKSYQPPVTDEDVMLDHLQKEYRHV